MHVSKFHIITFYEFKTIDRERLVELKVQFKELMRTIEITGTIILAEEGFNSTVCGTADNIARFVNEAESLLETNIEYKLSAHDRRPFRQINVKIKPEIVTLKKRVDIPSGDGTHVSPAEWNEIISDPTTFVLDTRNDYEFKTGSFAGAVNPETSKFSELPEFVEKHLDPERHKRIAMFCTGGIRCEKFAPYLKERGFEEVYQLRGGILKYLETMPLEESRWQGECFVFDDRVTVDSNLEKGSSADMSQDKAR
jgi:UPF0176 protein